MRIAYLFGADASVRIMNMKTLLDFYCTALRWSQTNFSSDLSTLLAALLEDPKIQIKSIESGGLIKRRSKYLFWFVVLSHAHYWTTVARGIY